MIRVLLCCLCWVSTVEAQIFRCERLDGVVYYQERTCIATTDTQTELLYYEMPRTQRQIAAIEKSLQRQRRQLLKAKQAEDKLKVQRAKQAKQQQKKRLRLRTKCANVRQQIARLNLELRNGYTRERGQLLNRKLDDCRSKQREYCINE